MTKIEDRIKVAPRDTIRRGWVNRLSPDFAWPYLQLMRADRPIGVWLLLWPGLWGIALASHSLALPAQAWDFYLPHPELMGLFAIGAYVMRGAGCVVNDLADRKFDGMVDRTKGRPLPSGRVSVLQAFLFLGALCLTGLAVLLQMNAFTIYLGIGSLALVAVYPFMKRITYWPQITLGLTFNFGALMGWSAVTGRLETPSLLLYAGGIFWTLCYDTIYAHCDKADDILIGVKSSALKLGARTPRWLMVFFALMLSCFAAAGALANMGAGFHIGLTLVAAHAVWQLRTLDIDDGETCLQLFKANRHLGFLLFLSILAGHYV